MLTITACSSVTSSMNGINANYEDVSFKTLSRHEEMARRYEASGDLAHAAQEWHVLTLLAPNERSYQRNLASTKEAINSAAAQAYKTGLAHYRKNQIEEASQHMLKVLALSPAHSDAAQILREIEKQKISSIQSTRAAKAARTKRPAEIVPLASSRSTIDPDQQIEMFTAGDIAGGLREMHYYVDANPNEKANRQRIADVVYEEAYKLDQQGVEEDALRLYDQAMFLRGDKQEQWQQKTNALRSKLASEYYAKGIQVYHTDISAAIRYWEKTLSIDPHYKYAATRLREAKQLKEKSRNLKS